MKAEQFDHYVRAQFENDVVAPPARLEGAVFAALEGQKQGRKGLLGAAALVLTLASSAALWMATRPVAEEVAPVTMPSIETPVVEELAAPPSASEQASVSTVLTAVTAQPEAIEVEATPSARTQSSAAAETQAPSTLETVDVRTIDGVPVDSETSAPELQQKDKETWVLPAVVKVND